MKVFTTDYTDFFIFSRGTGGNLTQPITLDLQIQRNTEIRRNRISLNADIKGALKRAGEQISLNSFMNLDTPLAAPFDLLTFRIFDYQDEYIPLGYPEFLQYYDSIVMSTPVMPNTYCVYQKKTDEGSTSEKFTSQWSSYFFEKNDFPIILKGYKDGDVKYAFQMKQIMRERDFLGIDWKNGGITLANPQSHVVYCVLDTRYEFLLTDTQLRNNIPFVKIKVAFASVAGKTSGI